MTLYDNRVVSKECIRYENIVEDSHEISHTDAITFTNKAHITYDLKREWRKLKMGKLFDVAISFAMENEELADTVYHYLKAEGSSVFYTPAPECQSILSGENQRKIFYRIFGLEQCLTTN